MTRVRLNVRLPAKARLKVETKMKPGAKQLVEMRLVVQTKLVVEVRANSRMETALSQSGPEPPSVVCPPALVEAKLHFEVRPRVDARTQACG